jgi:hypothetical protein
MEAPMGKTTYKPYDPAAAERQRQSRLTREGEARARDKADRARPQTWGVAAQALSLPANQDVEAVRDHRGRVVGAHRTDVFEILHGRGGLSDAELAAARRLETDMGLRARLFRQTDLYVLVDCQGGVEGATQGMIAAGERVERALAAIGPRQAVMLRALIEPGVHGRPVAWREVVARETAETNPHVQAAMVRSACDNLALAYRAIDADPRRGG